MFAAPGDGIFPARQYIQGVHLRFWPSWLDFWRNNNKNLSRFFPDTQKRIQKFGTSDRGRWIEIARDTIHTAVAGGTPYFVFPVAHMRPWEL